MEGKTKYITGISSLPLCSFQYLNRHMFHFEDTNPLMEEQKSTHLGFQVSKRIFVLLASLFKIGGADLFSGWAAQAAEQHGGHSPLQWGDCGGRSSSSKVFKHLKYNGCWGLKGGLIT